MPHLPSSQWTADEYGELSPAWDADAHAEWREKWAPAWPDENPQRLLRALGFRERNVGDLELRVALGGNGKSVAVTIATDVSGRGIDGANPTYLRHAKIYVGADALSAGTVLLTGTGIVPPDDVGLAPRHVVEISVAGIVVLRSPVGEATQSDERQEGGTNV